METTETRTSTPLLHLEFAVPGNELPVFLLRHLLQDIETTFEIMAGYTEFYTNEPPLSPSEISRRESEREANRHNQPEDSRELLLVRLQMASPLSLVFSLAKLPRNVVMAFWGFFQRMIYYEEEKSKRSAEAALKWEEVRARRIESARECLKLARQVEAADLSDGTVERLAQLITSITDTRLLLTRVGLEDVR